MARRSEHSKEEIKAMVLEAAENIIAEEGSQALTVRKIAAEIDYTIGCVYMVFDNMDTLIWQIRLRTLNEIIARMALDAEQESDPEQQLRIMTETYLEFASRHCNRWRMLSESQKEETPTPEYRQKVSRIIDDIADLLSRFGGTSAAWSPTQAAKVFWGSL